jgi:hypothetical protein
VVVFKLYILKFEDIYTNRMSESNVSDIKHMAGEDPEICGEEVSDTKTQSDVGTYFLQTFPSPIVCVIDPPILIGGYKSHHA